MKIKRKYTFDSLEQRLDLTPVTNAPIVSLVPIGKPVIKYIDPTIKLVPPYSTSPYQPYYGLNTPKGPLIHSFARDLYL